MATAKISKANGAVETVAVRYFLNNDGAVIQSHKKIEGLSEITEAEAAAFLEEKNAVTTEEIIKSYEVELDGILNQAAIDHGFANGRYSLAIRAGYSNEWQELAIAFGTWMDAQNVAAYALLQKILDGDAEMLTLEEFKATVPPFNYSA